MHYENSTYVLDNSWFNVIIRNNRILIKFIGFKKMLFMCIKIRLKICLETEYLFL